MIADPKIRLTKKQLKSFCDELVKAVAWNATPRGIDSQEDRGYTATSVVSGMLGDIMQVGSQNGVDIVEAVFSALAMHDSYGRRQCDEARAAAGALASVLSSPVSRDHAIMLQRPVKRG